LGSNTATANFAAVKPIFFFYFYLAKVGNGCTMGTVERRGAIAFAARFNANRCFIEQLRQRF
jgi:hypothetical protein